VVTIVAGASVTVAVLLYHYVELPMMAAIRGIGAKRATPA